MTTVLMLAVSEADRTEYICKNGHLDMDINQKKKRAISTYHGTLDAEK